VLCDPIAAARFDDLARRLVPGFSALQYRWAALRLRKDARLWRRSAQVQDPAAAEWRRIPLSETTLGSLRPTPGVYLLAPGREDAAPAYVGETWDLLRRAERTFQSRLALDQLMPNSGAWELRWFELEGTGPDARRGLQARLIADHRPAMNYLELAAREP
jgi:site-specific DNA-methyltransferase (adenine-specific)